MAYTLGPKVVIWRLLRAQSICHIPTWVVVKIMGPFWVLIIIRHLIFRVPKTGP